MGDIPAFNPNWYLDNPNLVGNNAIAFETIQETLAKTKLIKNVGIANLQEKSILMNDPACSIYDIVSAIKDIPASNGLAKKVPFQEDAVKQSVLDNASYGRLLSLPFIGYGENLPMKVSKLSNIEVSTSNQFLYDFIDNFSENDVIAPVELQNSINNPPNTTLIAAVAYELTDEELANRIIPYTLSTKNEETGELAQDWILLKKGTISVKNISTGLNSKMDIYVKKAETTNEICILKSEENRHFCFDLCAKIGYSFKPAPGKFEFLATGKTVPISKELEDKLLWFGIANLDLTGSRVYFSPDNIENFELFSSKKNKISKISINYDGEKVLNKNLYSSTNTTRLLMNIELGGEEW